VAFAGDISPVWRDTVEVFIGRDLVEQLGQNWSTTNIATGNFHGLNFQRFVVDPDVFLAPDAPVDACLS
jgi:hypothetical protein